MREFKRYRDERHKRQYYRSYDKYNSNKSDEYKVNHHHRINKYNGKNSYNNYEERKRDNKERTSHARVKISNLDYTISKNDLVELFSNVCKVVNAWINYDHTDRSNGTAVCIFENINDAQKAIDKYDGSEIEGLPMKMEIMHRKNHYSYKKKNKSRCPW